MWDCPEMFQIQVKLSESHKAEISCKLQDSPPPWEGKYTWEHHLLPEMKHVSRWLHLYVIALHRCKSHLYAFDDGTWQDLRDVRFRYSTPPIPSPLQTSVGGRKPSLRSTAQLGVAEKLAECIRTLGKCFALADGRMPLAHSLGQQSDLVELMSLRWLIEPQSLGCQPFDRVHLQREKGRKGDNREILFRLVKCP